MKIDYLLILASSLYAQGAGAWELRAAISLASLWSDPDERLRAREVVSRAIENIVGGASSSDVRAAQAVLAALA